MAISKTTKSMDPKLVAGKQKHEVAYEAKKQEVKPADVRQARAKAGPSRTRVEEEIVKNKKH